MVKMLFVAHLNVLFFFFKETVFNSVVLFITTDNFDGRCNGSEKPCKCLDSDWTVSLLCAGSVS